VLERLLGAGKAEDVPALCHNRIYEYLEANRAV